MSVVSPLRVLGRAALCHGWQALRRAGLSDADPAPVQFVIERDNWSIRWDGTYIRDGVNARRPGTMCLIERPERAAGRVVHFGSQYMWTAWGPYLPAGPAYVVSYFHGKPEDDPASAAHLEAFLAGSGRLNRIVTAARLTEDRLLSWGVPAEKLVRIPIGVDLARFTPPTPELRSAARRKFGVPEGHACVGSFQKDGVGWGEGLQPKRIKGPDVFLAAVESLARRRPVFVLLSGPARGYVKAGLTDLGVPHRHVWLDNYLDIVEAYHALDLYLVTSREEGGPKAVLESLATGVPLVSTRCGMAPELIEDGVTGGLVEVDDLDGLVERAEAVLDRPAIGDSWREAGRARIAGYDWSRVAEDHWKLVYQPAGAIAPGRGGEAG